MSSSPPSGYSESPNAKKPCKGILKSSSFDKQFGAGNRKSAKFDELNVLQTYHPPNKDYGHMKVDEPKTPYNYLDPQLAEQDELDANLLAEKLKVAQETARRASIHAEESDDDDEVPETEEQKAKRLEFEKRRKLHYNEASAIKLARKLIEEEIENDHVDDEEAARGVTEDSNDDLDDDDDEDEIINDDADKAASTSTQHVTSSANP